jgi:hypothetical protein
VYTLPYNVLTDFEPISLTATAPWLIVAKNDFPADDLQGLIVWLQANPDKATAGTAGTTPSCDSGFLSSTKTFRPPTSRHQKRSAHFKKPKSKSGGPS